MLFVVLIYDEYSFHYNTHFFATHLHDLKDVMYVSSMPFVCFRCPYA